MAQGKLEVRLAEAKGIENTDFCCNMDPYVIIKWRSQEQRSSIAKGQGREPRWNETFSFNISNISADTNPVLNLKIMDKDSISNDDFVGAADIPLEVVFEEGSIPVTAYNVVKDNKFKGEIRVGLTFNAEGRLEDEEEENYGRRAGRDEPYWHGESHRSREPYAREEIGYGGGGFSRGSRGQDTSYVGGGYEKETYAREEIGYGAGGRGGESHARKDENYGGRRPMNERSRERDFGEGEEERYGGWRESA